MKKVVNVGIIFHMTEEVLMREDWAFLMQDGQDVSEALASAPLSSGDLSELIHGFMGKHSLHKSEVVRRSRLNQTFAYQIIAGTRHPTRDKLIQLAFGLGIDVDDTCELLERGGLAALLPIVRRDVIIAYCLHHGFDLSACDDLLWELGEVTLIAGETRNVANNS